MAQRCVTEECKNCFLSKIREPLPGAVINITHPPTSSEDLSAPLCDPATEDSIARIREFSEQLTFCASSIRELEKASRGQSKSDVWKSQHKGRITASHFHDVNAKVKKLMRKTGQSVKCKVSPLLAKLLLLDDNSEFPSIRWGCMQEEDAAMEFLLSERHADFRSLEYSCKVEYLEMHEGKLELKRGHRWNTQITGEIAMSGLERLFVVVV